MGKMQSEEAWRELSAGPFFPDARLDCALAGLSGALVRRKGEGWQLALPYDPQRPFPLTELFCFAHLAAVRRKMHVVYTFDAQKYPLV